MPSRVLSSKYQTFNRRPHSFLISSIINNDRSENSKGPRDLLLYTWLTSTGNNYYHQRLYANDLHTCKKTKGGALSNGKWIAIWDIKALNMINQIKGILEVNLQKHQIIFCLYSCFTTPTPTWCACGSKWF